MDAGSVIYRSPEVLVIEIDAELNCMQAGSDNINPGGSGYDDDFDDED